MKSVAGIILAAGGSTRFGRPKQLLDWDGMPLVAHVVDVALAAGLDPVVVVVGAEAQAVHDALGERPVRSATNWRWQEGLSTSLRTGLALLPPDIAGAIFLHCDQPLVDAGLVQRLIARFRASDAAIVHPTLDGRQGTPVLFDRSLFPELATVSGDRGGREIIARYPEQVASIEVADPDRLADVDTPEAYERLQERAKDISPPDQLDLPTTRHLIVDMDGVLWRGNTPVEGLEDFFAFLRRRDVAFVLATNNASKRPEQYVQKLAGLGVDVPVESIVTSGLATAAYLADHAPAGAPVHVIGMEGIRDALSDQGFELVEENADYVVVGWTIELTWQKLAAATLQIRDGATFIGTNPDVTFPSEAGLVPGNGATLAALEAATGVTPTIIGKPEPWLYREAMDRMGASAGTTAVIGDRLETDILGGKRASIGTVLVLSGVSTRQDVAGSAIRPDLVCEDIRHVMQTWQEGES